MLLSQSQKAKSLASQPASLGQRDQSKRTVLQDVSTESSSGRSPWPFRAQCKELFLNWGDSNPQGHLEMSGDIFGGLV